MLSFIQSRGWVRILLVVFILLQISLLIFFRRSLLLSHYDNGYWKERLEHSQWVLPLSSRAIGDDGLFSYLGYTLIHGADPTWLNAETGPTGKYLLGLSIIIFQNQYILTFISALISAYLLFLISQKINKNTTLSIFVAFLFLADPIILYEAVSGSIDISQVLFLLLFCYFWLQSLYPKKYNILFPIAAGISLGLFSTIKLPILTPLLLIGFCMSFLCRRKIKEIVLFGFGVLVGFIIPYMQYFNLHHSLLDFLKLQKYIISFYTKSHLSVHHMAIWQVLFQAKFPDIVSGIATSLPEWWVVWPIGFISSIILFLIFLRKRMYVESFLICLFIFLPLILFMLIPIYPRYLLLVTPFFYILLGKCITLFPWKKKLYILPLIVLCTIFITHSILRPDPKIVLQDYLYNFSHGYFSDIYAEDIANGPSLHMSRNEFNTVGQRAFFDGQIVWTNFSVKKQIDTSEGIYILGDMEYTTRNLGIFSEEKTIHLVLVQGVWKVVWNWGLLLHEYSPMDRVETTLTTGHRGTILDTKGNILAGDKEGYLVSVKPSAIDPKKENTMLSLMSMLSGVKAVHLQNAYLENPPINTYIPIFTPMKEVAIQDISSLKNFPGVQVTTFPTRVYVSPTITEVANTLYPECCTVLYSSTAYHGASGLEKQYDLKLSGQDGGSLVILNPQGQIIRTILEKQPKDGENVVLPL